MINQELFELFRKDDEQKNNSDGENNDQHSSKVNQEGGGKKVKPKQEDLLYNLAVQNRNLYRDKNEKTYIEICNNTTGQTSNNYLVEIESQEFNRWLLRQYHINYKKIVTNKYVLENIRVLVSEEARISGKLIELNNRIAQINGSIYIDLGRSDRQIVKVDHTGWTVGTFPVFFKRHRDIAELPLPTSGGKIEEIYPFLPSMSRRDRCLTLCWLIASFFSDIERAFLLLEGSSGTGKTTLGKLLKSFIDPTHGEALTYHDNVNQVAQILDHHCIPLIDNVTKVSSAVSNVFCSAFSSGVHSKRKQYTDDEDFLLSITGNVIFTTTGLNCPRDDFLNRCIKIIIDKGDNSFRSKQLYSQKFDEIYGRLFGAVLTVLQETMVKVHNIQPVGMFRTVDFDRHCAAAAEVMGFGANFYFKARKYSESLKLKSISDDTPIIEALSNYLKLNNYYFSGYLGKLLPQLSNYCTSPELLPRQANALSRRMREMKPELEAIGIYAVKTFNDGTGTLWEIKFVQQETSNSDEQFRGNTDTEAPPPNIDKDQREESIDSDINPFLSDYNDQSSL